MKSKKVFLLAVLLVFCFGLHVSEAAAVPLPLKACKAITVSGSYILTKNIVAAGDCFVIQVDNVTIDLDGYTITGDGTGEGITDLAAARKNITVRNGVVTNFDIGVAIDVISHATIERMRVTRNTHDGIVVGMNSIVKDNIASENGVRGIVARGGSLVTGNIANNNGTYGIYVNCPTNLIGNIATGNTTRDFILVGAGCTYYNNNPAP